MARLAGRYSEQELETIRDFARDASKFFGGDGGGSGLGKE